MSKFRCVPVVAAALLASCGLAAAQGGAAKQAEQPASKEVKKLQVGDKAPPVSVEKWLKGEPVTGFEKGRVYVVEFWATWCGPCIISMPHISELQKQYKDKGLTIIGTNIWEDRTGPYSDETLEKVEKFVAESSDKMAYTVAYDGASKSMEKNWMRAAGRGGIPAAFLVDQNGVIAWIGHPMMLDYPIEEVIAGRWDPKTSPQKLEQVQKEMGEIAKLGSTDPKAALVELQKFEAKHPKLAAQMDSMKLGLLVAAGEYDKLYELMGPKVDKAIASKNAQELNSLSWMIVDPDGQVKEKNLDLAYKAASKAVEFTKSEDGAILDTLARVHFLKGDIDKAIELQTKAVAVAHEAMKDQLEATLDEYKDAKK